MVEWKNKEESQVLELKDTNSSIAKKIFTSMEKN